MPSSEPRLRPVHLVAQGRPHHCAQLVRRPRSLCALTDLPSYSTSNGAILDPDEGRVTSPVCMWPEALDLILERIRAAGIYLGRVIGIGGAEQVCIIRFA